MKRYILTVLLVSLVLLVGCGPTLDTTAPVKEPIVQPVPVQKEIAQAKESTIKSTVDGIKILGKEGFDPASATVGKEVAFSNNDPAKKSTTITFQNKDTKKVTTTGLIKAGETYTHVFGETGTYSYWTTAHGVKATLVVE
jgi:plastocyanin